MRKHCLSAPCTPPLEDPPRLCKYSSKVLLVSQTAFDHRVFWGRGGCFVFLKLQNKISQSTFWKLVPHMSLKVPPSLRLVQG